jgi:hypothetical protein
MATCRRSSKNMEKMSFIFNFNKSSLWAHMELELDVLGVYGKLVKYVVHLSRRKKKEKKGKKISQKLPK